MSQPAGHAAAALAHLAIALHHREGGAEVEAWLIGHRLQLQHRPAQQGDRLIQHLAGEAGHVAALIQVRAQHGARVEAQMPAPARQGAPGVVHDRATATLAMGCTAIGGDQLALSGIHGGQATAAQEPALIAAGRGFKRLPLLGGDVLQGGANAQLLRQRHGACCDGFAACHQVVAEKRQLELIEATVPLQMAPGPQPQPGFTAGSACPLPEIQHAEQVGIVPAADQQHGPAPERRWWLMPAPPLSLGRIELKPRGCHAIGIQSLQQRLAVAQKIAALQAAADLPPAFVIAAALAGLGRQLQPPAKPEGPPVATTLAGPVAPLIQACHGWCQRIGQLRVAGQKQLCEPLIREAVTPHPPVAPALGSHPGEGASAIGGLLAEAAEVALGVAAAAHVLHHHGKAVLRIPLGVGEANSGCDGPPIGLAHQQNRPGA